MTTHHSPITTSDETGADAVSFEQAQADMVLAGRAVAKAQYLAGLIVASQLATAGNPGKLARDVWPDEDPALIDEVSSRWMAVGFYAAELARRPYLHRDELARYQAVFDEMGHQAMAKMVGRSLATAVQAHPADAESEERSHDEW